jgi:NAD(P)-dependent dehydrogenase (short-subunit alcohol dehydrogenase family)
MVDQARSDHAPNKVAVVVGVGPGMGMALARRFGSEGYALGLIARDFSKLKGEIAEAGLQAVGVSADASDEASLRSAFAEIRENLGDPEVLLYNPSLGIPGMPTEVAPADVVRGLLLGAVGAVVAAQESAPAMRAAAQGTMLFTGSIVGIKPWAPGAALGMQKAALRNYVYALADELAPDGIHVAMVTIKGVITPGTHFDPALIADEFWNLHVQPRESWATEVVYSKD